MVSKHYSQWSIVIQCSTAPSISCAIPALAPVSDVNQCSIMSLIGTAGGLKICTLYRILPKLSVRKPRVDSIIIHNVFFMLATCFGDDRITQAPKCTVGTLRAYTLFIRWVCILRDEHGDFRLNFVTVSQMVKHLWIIIVINELTIHKIES